MNYESIQKTNEKDKRKYKLRLGYQTPKMIPGAIHTIWYKGFAGNNAKNKFREKHVFLRKSQPKTQRLIGKKVEL